MADKNPWNTIHSSHLLGFWTRNPDMQRFFTVSLYHDRYKISITNVNRSPTGVYINIEIKDRQHGDITLIHLSMHDRPGGPSQMHFQYDGIGPGHGIDALRLHIQNDTILFPHHTDIQHFINFGHREGKTNLSYNSGDFVIIEAIQLINYFIQNAVMDMVTPTPGIDRGMSHDAPRQKYLKYKQKYLELKKKLEL